MSVGFPGAGETCASLPRKLFPGAWERSHSFTIEKMYRFARRQGKLCPGAGKAISRRPGKFTFIHYRRKMFRFSRRRGKLCPGAGKKSHSFTIEEKCAGFPAPGEAVSRRRKVLERGSGEVSEQGCRESVSFPGARGSAEKAVSRRRVNIEEKCVGFPGAGGSCAPAPGKLFPGAGERSHSFSIGKMCRFCRCWGKLCLGAGKLFPGAEES